MAKNISFTIKFWRQNGPKDQGHFDTHEMKDIPDDTSFLEMLDILNEEHPERGAHQRRQGAFRIRPRLPRGYLRYVLTLHQRYTSRSYRAWCYNLSALHAPFQRW